MNLLRRMALVALVVGTATAVAGTGRVTVSLVLSGTLLWSVVPLLQLVSGLILVRGAGWQALDGYFATHRFWSLWMLGFAGMTLILPNPGGSVLYLVATAVVPMWLTGRALTRFCREALGLSGATARRRVALHQVVTYVAVLVYADFAVALVPRILAVVGK